jgi:hypothetical protein
VARLSFTQGFSDELVKLAEYSAPNFLAPPKPAPTITPMTSGSPALPVRPTAQPQHRSAPPVPKPATGGPKPAAAPVHMPASPALPGKKEMPATPFFLEGKGMPMQRPDRQAAPPPPRMAPPPPAAPVTQSANAYRNPGGSMPTITPLSRSELTPTETAKYTRMRPDKGLDERVDQEKLRHQLANAPAPQPSPLPPTTGSFKANFSSRFRESPIKTTLGAPLEALNAIGDTIGDKALAAVPPKGTTSAETALPAPEKNVAKMISERHRAQKRHTTVQSMHAARSATAKRGGFGSAGFDVGG